MFLEGSISEDREFRAHQSGKESHLKLSSLITVDSDVSSFFKALVRPN